MLENITAGDTFIGGVAWAQQNGGVAKVQVQIDGGAWQDAELGPSVGNDYWRQWYFPWTAESGSHNLVHAVSSTATATSRPTSAMDPFPEGSCGIQNLIVKVA